MIQKNGGKFEEKELKIIKISCFWRVGFLGGEG